MINKKSGSNYGCNKWEQLAVKSGGMMGMLLQTFDNDITFDQSFDETASFTLSNFLVMSLSRFLPIKISAVSIITP